MRTVIRLTAEQRKDLSRLKTRGDAWYERLADITECPPEVLRTRFSSNEVLIQHTLSEKEEMEQAALGWPIRSYGHHLYVVTPVPQDVSGGMVFID